MSYPSAIMLLVPTKAASTQRTIIELQMRAPRRPEQTKPQAASTPYTTRPEQTPKAGPKQGRERKPQGLG